MIKLDFIKITPCGGCCEDCGHFSNNECKGCLANEGKCIHMWQGSNGICKVYSCCKEHNVAFCGLCEDFPCSWLKDWFDSWNKDGIDTLKKLKDEYGGIMNEIINHYDLLIDENNDPVRDVQILRDYMDKWDGQAFFNLLQLDKTKTVLEIGVGTGRLAIKTISKCRHFTGIDISQKTIERAKANLLGSLENLAEFENKTLICADFLEYNFNEQFDVIYSSLTFLHIKEKQKAIEKIASLLKNGGRFVLSINKDQATELDFGTRKVPLYPNTPEEVSRIIEKAALKITAITQTEFAWVLVATKSSL